MRNNGCALASLSSFLPDPNRTHQIHLNRAHQTPEAPNPPLLHRSPAAAPAPAIPGGRPYPTPATPTRPQEATRRPDRSAALGRRTGRRQGLRPSRDARGGGERRTSRR
ncbi:hypothetical protein PVAP13_7KG384500 [Panicum virgatum]|uniref:Uncharacterized protein n=1 Tax=Panicum virgatum TaxID=38727 RepID=A0A8T0QR39_PANVG|nr:hypothetical protein PVAP13_7KG384500 [Panicum virgatum]